MPETNEKVWQLREEVENKRQSILSDPIRLLVKAFEGRAVE
jgi:hypothetical protein